MILKERKLLTLSIILMFCIFFILGIVVGVYGTLHKINSIMNEQNVSMPINKYDDFVANLEKELKIDKNKFETISDGIVSYTDDKYDVKISSKNVKLFEETNEYIYSARLVTDMNNKEEILSFLKLYYKDSFKDYDSLYNELLRVSDSPEEYFNKVSFSIKDMNSSKENNSAMGHIYAKQFGEKLELQIVGTW